MSLDIATLGKGTRFKCGNTAAVGRGDIKLHGALGAKEFKAALWEVVTNLESGVKSGTKPGLLAVLKEVLYGYKGVKPGDRLKAAELILKTLGILKDQVEVEQVNPFSGVDNVTLVAVAEKLTLALKGDPLVAAERVVSGGDSGESQSGS